VHLLRRAIAIEFADQGITVPSGPIGQVSDEGFDLSSTGISEGWGTAIGGSIGFDEARVEVMLTDEQAELVAEARLTVVVTVVPVRGRHVVIRSVSTRGPRGPAEFFDRAEANAIGLAEGAIDSAGFGYAHLTAADKN
jgi:hypothetical protein